MHAFQHMHTCSGVPERAQRYLACSAKTALAVAQRLSLMLCASSSTMRRQRICRKYARQQFKPSLQRLPCC